MHETPWQPLFDCVRVTAVSHSSPTLDQSDKTNYRISGQLVPSELQLGVRESLRSGSDLYFWGCSWPKVLRLFSEDARSTTLVNPALGTFGSSEEKTKTYVEKSPAKKVTMPASVPIEVRTSRCIRATIMQGHIVQYIVMCVYTVSIQHGRLRMPVRAPSWRSFGRYVYTYTWHSFGR